jgi:ketosteroid isomerase-like protein
MSGNEGKELIRQYIQPDGIVIHRVRDGKIVEYWSVVDTAHVLQQVGALPGPPG